MALKVKNDDSVNRFIRDIATDCKTISFIGFEKGSGKTTALKAFLSAFNSKKIGVTSMGTPELGSRTKLADYPVYVQAGTMVATTRKSFGRCDTTSEVLRTTGIRTSTGEVILFKALSAGHVFLAGPAMIADSKKLRDLFFEEGAELVLIDCATDRKSAAYPAHADGVVVTGRHGGGGGKAVDEKLAVEMDNLLCPVLEDDSLVKVLQRYMQSESPYFIVDEDQKPWLAERGESKTRILELLQSCQNNIKAIMIKGALTNFAIRPLLKASGNILNKLHGTIVTAEDPAKIFLDASHRQSLERLGMKLRVLNGVKVLALCLNPSREGLSKEQVTGILENYSARFSLPVIDLLGGMFIEGI